MSFDQFMAALAEGIRLIGRLSIMLVSWLLDAMRTAGPIRVAVPVLLVCAIAYGVSTLMQRRLNRLLSESPETAQSMLWQEVVFSLPGMILYLMALPFILMGRAIQKVTGAIKRRTKRKQDAEVDGDDPELQARSRAIEAEADAEDEEQDPVLVASLGPSFVLAAVGCGWLYLLGLIFAPLARAQLGLNEGTPVWQYAMLGSLPELHWYLPLDRHPWLGGGLIVGFWFAVWWWLGRLLRVALSGELGANLIERREDDEALHWWRRWLGAPELWRPSETFLAWAPKLPLIAAPLLLWSFAMLAGEPYRTDPSQLAIALLLALSWVMHLRLRGVERLDEEAPEEVVAPSVTAHGWEDVLSALRERFNIRQPHLFDAPRPVEPLAYSTIEPEAEGIVTPLLLELLPEDSPGLTHMQYVVLRDLSLQGFVHMDPPAPRGELDLSTTAAAIEDMTGMRERNQIVLAPEGAGKSTLALLAACNHAIVHTRTTMIITRDDERAMQLWGELSARLEPSTLRWNIRLRRMGGDLVNDLAQGVIPDIVVCSLRQLVVQVLDEANSYAPFLQNMGLIVVDDVEDFCGPVETHAQLAFRRLVLRVEDLLAVRELGEEISPIMLVLGADTMHDTPAWTRALCGVDAVARYFDYSSAEAAERDAALKAFQGIESVRKAGGEDGEVERSESDASERDGVSEKVVSSSKPAHGAGVPKLPGRYQLVYRLADLRNPDDEAITVRDVVEACERLAVPWHYRPCGDGRRHVGRERLSLRDEPKYYAASPQRACVIFLEGSVSSVRREIERLYRAGASFAPIKRDDRKREDGATLFADRRARNKASADSKGDASGSIPIAIITIIDRDEEMAFTELNVHSTLADALETLPRPVVRPPTGRVVREHLAAELTTSWIEVADVLDIFGNPTATTLTRLAEAGMLMSEARTDLHPDLALYEERVFVRATTRAMSPERRGDRARRFDDGLLPPKVSQVELASGNRVAIRERTTLNVIELTDAESAGLVFYLGRIFEHARGRFIVVGTGASEKDKDETIADEDILVEPYLNDGISSPRRRVWIDVSVDTGARAAAEDEDAEAEAGEEGDSIDEELAELERRILALDRGAYNRKAGEDGQGAGKRAVSKTPRTVDRLPTIEPVLIGDFPVAVSLTPITCRAEHVATYRLGPVLHEVRQRIIFNAQWREAHTPQPFETTALGLYPNPEIEDAALDTARRGNPPELALEEARLIAATMRAILPMMYRGASSSLEVALHITRPQPPPEHILGPHEGFFLYDPLPGGTGAARALHRDGVELLLRLCRVYIERVLYHDRLRARFDLWGDEAEILGRRDTDAPEPGPALKAGTLFIDLDAPVPEDDAGEDEAYAPAVASTPGGRMRDRDREVRRKALIWLDSRLRPEGSLAGGRTLGKYGSGDEVGEGDLSDIGRCWFSRSGAVTDLLWAKHRWQLDEDGGEAMVDVGMDRDTAAASRFLEPDSPLLAAWLATITEQLGNTAGFTVDDEQRVWGAARPLWALGAGEEIPAGTPGELLTKEPVQVFHRYMGALAMHDWEALRPLAHLLGDRSGGGTEDEAARYRLIQYMARFVQGIPSTALADPRGSAYSPVRTLLRRVGDADAKSLALAMLLRHCGVDSGLFVSLEDGRALCAAAAFEAPSLSAGDVMPRVQQWRADHDLSEEDLIWGELPPRPGGAEDASYVYVPVDTMRYAPPGVARVEAPERWVFLPLAPAWYRVGAEEDDAARRKAAQTEEEG